MGQGAIDIRILPGPPLSTCKKKATRMDAAEGA
jgi:hypothetical protein